MNFDDNNPDYFLHDFDKNGTSEPTPPAAGTQEPSRRVNFDEAPPVTPPLPSQKRGCRRGWVWFFTIVIIALAATIYIRYFTPYVTDSCTTGYITNVERRGIFFKTFEGEMISETALTDTTHVYTRDFVFSIPNDSVARAMQSLQGSGRPVRVTYERFYGTLPWRGASTCIVTAVEPQ